MKKNFKHNPQSGFIALMSVIVISAVLLVLAVSVSITGFFSRFNVVDMEYKNRSSALAEACIDTALLRLAQDSSNVSTGSVPVGSDTCTVVAVLLDTPNSGQITIETKGIFQQSVTNYKVIVDSNNLSLISMQELASL